MRLNFDETNRDSVIKAMARLDALLQALPVPDRLVGTEESLRTFAKTQKARGLLSYYVMCILNRARKYYWAQLKGYIDSPDNGLGGIPHSDKDYKAYLAEDGRTLVSGFHVHELRPDLVMRAIKDYPEYPSSAKWVWAYLATLGVFRPRQA